MAMAYTLVVGVSGCANFSAKVTGSARSGSEQLLTTGAADRAIACIDFRPLGQPRAFLDASRVTGPDAAWIAFALRRSMARQGLIVVDDRRDAQVVVEAALAASGTDEVDCRLLTPSGSSGGLLSLLGAGGASGGASTSSTYAIGRKVRQDAVVKLALVAFDEPSRRLVWESGTRMNAETLDRRLIATEEVERSASLDELDRYPRRTGKP